MCNLNTCNCKIKSHWISTTPAAATDRKHEDELSLQDNKSAGTQQHPPLQGTFMHTWYVPCMFTVLQRRVVHAVDNSTEDGVAEEDGYEISGTVRQPKLAATRVLRESTAKHTVMSSVILLHNPTFNASTAIS